MNEHQVAITGLGVVTPIGIGVKDFCEGLKVGQNGIAKVTHFDVTDFRSKLAAEVKDFHAEEWIDKKSARRMDRFTKFGIAASAMAMEDVEIDSFSIDKNRAGVIIGSGIGGSQTYEDAFSSLQEMDPMV